MRYVISSSDNRNEINRFFMSEVTPRIGKAFRYGGGVFKVVDIEWIERSNSRLPEVRGMVARVM